MADRIEIRIKRYFNGERTGSDRLIAVRSGAELAEKVGDLCGNGWGARPVVTQSQATALGAYQSVYGEWFVPVPGNDPVGVEIESSRTETTGGTHE